MHLIIEIVIIVLGFFFCLSIGFAIWMYQWTKNIPQRAFRKVAREFGVSDLYLQAVLHNNKQYASGKITKEEWEKQAIYIAKEFPYDNKTYEDHLK